MGHKIIWDIPKYEANILKHPKNILKSEDKSHVEVPRCGD